MYLLSSGVGLATFRSIALDYFQNIALLSENGIAAEQIMLDKHEEQRAQWLSPSSQADGADSRPL